MFASHVVTSVDRTSFYFLFEDFLSAVVNNHLLCYWPIIQNSISKICPKFQVLSSHFFKVDELLNKQWAKIVWSEIFQLQRVQSMSNAIRCIDQRFAFKNSGISCLALIFNLSIPRTIILPIPMCKKAVPGCQKRRLGFIYSFFH